MRPSDLNQTEPSQPAEGLQEAETRLREELPAYESLDPSTRRCLLGAEFLHENLSRVEAAADLTRPAGFAWAYAVEHEAKLRLGSRIKCFVEDPETPALIEGLLESGGRRLSIHYERDILRTLRGRSVEVSAENFLHTFRCMREHGSRYRPDGLKALGILVICFGRFTSLQKGEDEIEIYNPLRLSGLSDSDAVLAFGVDLINLQHARNPFIHPELGEPVPVDAMRDRSLSLLRMMSAI